MPSNHMAVPSFETFATSGIYFLYRRGVVVYVGQAVDMRRRIAQHLAEGVKQFDEVACRRCPAAKLDKLERRFIERLVPEYNRCQLANSLRIMGNQSSRPPTAEGYLTAAAAAAFLGVDIAEFERLRVEGSLPRMRRLPRSRARRFHTADLEQIVPPQR